MVSFLNHIVSILSERVLQAEPSIPCIPELYLKIQFVSVYFIQPVTLELSDKNGLALQPDLGLRLLLAPEIFLFSPGLLKPSLALPLLSLTTP